MMRYLGFTIFLVTAWLIAGGSSAADGSAQEVRPLLTRYCFSCHGETKPKAGLNLESLQSQENVRVWKEVWNRVRARQMPPSDQPQPTMEERARLTDWIEDNFAKKTLDG